jgi:hypothetical protein
MPGQSEDLRTGEKPLGVRSRNFELLNETLFIGLGHARCIIVAWVATTMPTGLTGHSALGYQTLSADATQRATTVDQVHETEALRQSPIAPSAQAGNCHAPALVSGGRAPEVRAVGVDREREVRRRPA